MIVASPPTLNEGEYGAGNEQQQPEPRKRSIGGILASTESVREERFQKLGDTPGSALSGARMKGDTWYL